ncbi:MAG: ABC-2 family transporter protein [Cyanobacteria bacterium P01_H01_bin.15]
MLEYRAEIILWALSGTLPLILMGVWVKAADSGDFGFTATEFARYFFCLYVIRQFTTIWVIWEFEKEIVQGTLSLRLLQPIDPVWHHVTRHLAEKLTRIPFVVLLTGLFFWLYPAAAWLPNAMQIISCIIAIVLAFALRFVIQYTFAMLAFWTERASAIQQFWFLFYIFLSGTLAPLTVFPENIQTLVLWTPFPYTLYFPVALLMGIPVPIGRGLVAITLWGLGFFLLNRWLWKQGLKKFSGMGA